ncbi:UDP-2-acetamido-3-amino-2,3-dideoxy-glucuronate N-acetyltransferase [Lewinella aquimaris]|uniref:UDP-2-acetamido-3-amino-2,3-dideoxy-glucuronate N-acetyltransferase n=1 Tax=Neolewinella aquimaris TaxID=1835722 RepID=A0A840E921_9BACT|nr:acyltransferase [Neolewinella aquimaris]MBB4078558.1 UDP-2-acetamido-3-amino-2,3-dideoxy-glucuronate N-acetyltransferase [Neolewinella aquimaris]
MNYYAHPTAVIDPGARVGADCNVWHFSHLMPDCELGERCNIGQNVFIAGGVRLGHGCKVQNNVSLYAGLQVGNNVFIGPSAVFTNVRNPRSAIDRRGQYTPTVLADGVTIGANATIVCGVTLHEYAFVGAGAVVTADVAAFGLVVGTPARLLGYVSAAGHRLHFDTAGIATCPETGETYVLREEGVVRQSA